MSELARVAAPGGTIIMVTWCHRDLKPGEEALQAWEQTLLNRICDAFYLPAWCSTADYVDLLQSLSLRVGNLFLKHIQTTLHLNIIKIKWNGRTSKQQIGRSMWRRFGRPSYARLSHGRASPLSWAPVYISPFLFYFYFYLYFWC